LFLIKCCSRVHSNKILHISNGGHADEQIREFGGEGLEAES
jgi:hypothetical protein